MSSNEVYSTEKILHHEDACAGFRSCSSHNLNPIFVHLMIQNVCNQSCSFCSYRLPDWKNSQQFDTSKAIPIDKLLEIIDDLEEMGVKAVELTGGGEPMAYPQKKELLRRLSSSTLEVGLVSNGTLIDDEIADMLFDTELKWVRISIDSGNPLDYSRIRNVSTKHWHKAWDAVDRLVERAKGRETVIGLGFVATNDNCHGVDSFIYRAHEHGVSNVRIAYAFTPRGDHLLSDDQVTDTLRRLDEAKQRLAKHPEFKINDLFLERLDNMRMSPTQDYDYCGSKDVLCVIEGECKVYTCCTLTGDPRGLIGSVREQRFADLWREKAGWREKFDVRKRCKCACLYEKRNETMTALREGQNVVAEGDKPPHVNFI